MKLYIAGQASDAASGEVFSTYNPATGRELAKVQCAGRQDVDRAVAAAAAAFPAWAEMSGAARGKILRQAAALLRDHAQSLAELEVADAGKPITEALTVDLPSAAEVLEYFAGVALTLHGHHYQLGRSFAYTLREPLGVCAGIGAWNYPLQIACWKAAPALASGNTVVFKPSELTPLSAMRLAEIFTEAGLPSGVFNVLQGGASVGKVLVEHPDVAKISLTGAAPTGKAVMAAAAATLKHVTLELGGKSPLIIFPDADLDQAVAGAMLANFYTQGEVCSNGTRVFVHGSIKQGFLEKLRQKVASLKIGDPQRKDTQVGALISAAHRAKIESFIASGLAEGARLLVGGTAPNWGPGEAHLRGGHFIAPTVFDGCGDHMQIVREEIFGPVMAVLEFGSEEEVIKRANSTPFGLAAGIFTRDLTRAHRVVKQLQAGVCWINTYNVTPVEVPFGGVKASGLGRENGLAAIEFYTQVKTVYVEMDPLPTGP